MVFNFILIFFYERNEELTAIKIKLLTLREMLINCLLCTDLQKNVVWLIQVGKNGNDVIIFNLLNHHNTM
jgi:hypothetical protein